MPEEKRQKASYFNWYYFALNCGALLSYTGIAYLCQVLLPTARSPVLARLAQDFRCPQNVSFASGYAVPACAMVFAIIVFWLGRNR